MTETGIRLKTEKRHLIPVLIPHELKAPVIRPVVDDDDLGNHAARENRIKAARDVLYAVVIRYDDRYFVHSR